jgi:FtsP/CotA-like multicopper oxidase with cupredoxin domain
MQSTTHSKLTGDAPRPRRPRATLVTASALLVAVATAFAGCALIGPPAVSTVGDVQFVRPLRIPALATTRVNYDGEKVVELTAQAGERAFGNHRHVRTLGFADAVGSDPGNSYLGPTIALDRGDDVRVDVRNALDRPTTVHWHGMHLPAAMDGGPHQPILPGESWSPHWRVDQHAATLWYHPHPHEQTTGQVARGMAGMVIVHDEAEHALNLPREYGVDDIPVIVQDQSFDDNGQLTTNRRSFIGPLGDSVVVNGTVGGYLTVTTDVVRLRLLNASAARVYRFALDDGDLELIATGGGLLPAPQRLRSIQLAPGERAEVLVRLQPGERATLGSLRPDLGADAVVSGANGGSDRFDVLQLRAADRLRSLGATPSSLVPMHRLSEDQATRRRSFTLEGHEINGREMDPGRIDETITVDTTELWAVRNTSGEPHSFHVHDVQFQVLSVAGEPPPVSLSGWKDTVYVPPQTELRLIMRFADYTDPDTPYMYHCHMLWHEDRGMMGQFVVVTPGQKAGTPPPLQHRSNQSGYGPRSEENHDHDHS